MLARLTSLLLACSALALAGCKSAAPAAAPAPTSPAQDLASNPLDTPSFPSDWFGTWSGPAEVARPANSASVAQGDKLQLTMGLVIGPTSDPNRFTWTVIYEHSGEKHERKYELVVVDAARGQYEIDEKNSITLPTTLIGGTLRSTYIVEGVQVITCERLERTPSGPRIVSEMLSVDTTSPRKTGGQGEGTGKIPEVTIFSPRALQRAVLTRTMPR